MSGGGRLKAGQARQVRARASQDGGARAAGPLSRPGCACLGSKPSNSLALSADTKKGVSRKGKKPWSKQGSRGSS